MNVKRWIVIGLMGILMAVSATPSMAMDRFDQIWVRDIAIGGGAGLIVGLTSSGSTASWVLVGLVAGGIFGYFDAKNGLIADATSPPSPWAPSPRLMVETRPIDGREQPQQILKATLYQVQW